MLTSDCNDIEKDDQTEAGCVPSPHEAKDTLGQPPKATVHKDRQQRKNDE
jgi:hypothetical protein